MKNHPYADMFPMMTDVELAALADDIAANGLRRPVVRFGEKILDGRNRLAACERAKVKPTFMDFEGDEEAAWAFVVSENVQRRDMTSAQRAIVAARAIDQMPERHGGDRKSDQAAKSLPLGRSRDAVAKAFKVSGPSVQQAKSLLDSATDLAAQVESCVMSLAEAYRQFQDRQSQQKTRERSAERVTKYRDAISSGEISLEAALAEIDKEAREEKELVASHADARKHFLQDAVRIVECLTITAQLSDETIGWNFEQGPGWFDHGLTTEAFAVGVKEMERMRTIFEGMKSAKGSNGAQSRPQAARANARAR